MFNSGSDWHVSIVAGSAGTMELKGSRKVETAGISDKRQITCNHQRNYDWRTHAIASKLPRQDFRLSPSCQISY